MTDWRDLDRELDAWRTSGREVTLWWRDDDAAEDTGPLRKLIALSIEHGTPLTLASVPCWVRPSLAPVLERASAVVPVQHGFAHRNWAPENERKAEFTLARTEADMRQDIARGWEPIRRLPRSMRVFVPPWNRGLEHVRPMLQALGYHGVSAYGPRPAEPQSPRQVNTHVDIIDWRGSRGFIGLEHVLGPFVRHLGQRRLGQAVEPTGLLTHHLDHDADCWDFLGELFARTRRAGARWLDTREVFTS
jgi:hypothetical protein